MADVMQFWAAGQRLLLQEAPAPAVEVAAPPAAAPAPPNNTGYDVSFGTSACTNSTSPICYSTAISGENLITGMWVNLILGLICYLGFVLFRGLRGFEFYHARLLLTTVSRKPPHLQLHGHRRLWGWLQPVFWVSDEELVRSAGLDALIAVRIISFGVTLFLPMTLLGMAVLLPVNYTSDYYKQYAEQEGMDNFTSVFMRMTISNIRQRSPLLWIHFSFVYLNVFWASWLIIEYYKEYIALRQTYLVRCTTMPGDARPPSSSSTTPLLTPSMAPSRSPLKRGLALAQSPTKRGSSSGTAGGSNASPAAALGLLRTNASGTLGKAINRLKLPRRNASRAADEFGEFAFRPSRFATPSSSPPYGSPSHASRVTACPPPGDVAAAGSIFNYPGPSRFSHQRSGSSPSGAAAGPNGGGSDGAAQGLAAALAALPEGSPVRDGAAGQLRSASAGGIELADAAAFGSSMVVAGTPAAGGGSPTGEWEPDASGASTPGSDPGEAGAGGGRARRPLLYQQALSSSDRPPPQSRGTSQRELSLRERYGCVHRQQQEQSNGVAPQPPLSPFTGGPAAVAGTPGGAFTMGHFPQDAEQQQQQAELHEQRGRLSGDAEPTRSLSFGGGSGLGAIGSLSLRGSQSEVEDQADTAASQPAAAAAPHRGDSAAEGRVTAGGVLPSKPQTSNGSSQALLSLVPHPDSGAGPEGSTRSWESSPVPPGASTQSGGSSVALLALAGQEGDGGQAGSPTEDALPVCPRHNPTSSLELAVAMGFDQTPPNADEINAAILSRSMSQRVGGSDSLAAVYGAKQGDDGDGLSEGGGEGIATRWWTAYQPAVNGITLPPGFNLNQSITMKGAVQLSVPSGGPTGGGSGASGGQNQSQLAVNASLFTCLVMDMPLERLKLRRLGVFPPMWRSLQEESSRSLSRTGTLGSGPGLAGGSSAGGTAAGNGAAGVASQQEDIVAALDELERGQKMDGGREDVESHATGVLGMLSRILSVWRNRGRLAEWRRDVRWAMYNKRVRVATEMFSELFGADFEAIIPIYPTASVDRLAHRWDSKVALLERLQLALRETPRHKPRRSAKLKLRIMALQREVAQLQGDIAAERDAVLSDLPSTCFFATFRSQQAAAIATQTNLNPIMQRLFQVEPAPRPDDVNWPALQRSWWQRTMRPLYALPLILFLMLLPIGMFTGAFAQLTIALCGNPADPSTAQSDSWYCSDDRWAAFLRNAITSLAPSIVLSIYNMVFLPVMVYYAAQLEGQHTSLSSLDRRCADLFFYWDVFNVFLGALFGGTVLAELKTFLHDPAYIWSALGSAIPAASNFFINYVMYRALVMSAFRLLYPHQAIMPSILKWLRIVPRAKTPRDKLMEVPPRNCRYGRDIGIPVLMNFVMVCSMCITSPLILPFGLLYFAGLWAVWRYQMLYVYQRQYESGGQFWPLVAHKVVGCQFIMVIFTACVLLFKGGYTQAALLFITMPIYLLRFDNYLTKRYDDLVRQVPLMAVHSAGRSSVPADIYTPPPLRAGGQGWHPEWGKVWQHWGIGRYTI